MDRLEPGDRATGEAPAPHDDACTLEEWKLMGRPESLTLEIDADQDLDEDYEALVRAHRVVLRFPVFMDGRGFSHARRLRAAGFAGELIAAGDVLPDQWAFLERCGFSSIASPETVATAADLPQLRNAYQADALQRQPLFRRR